MPWNAVADAIYCVYPGVNLTVMTKSVERLRVDSVSDGFALAANSDARLVLLVGRSVRALREAADGAAEQLGWREIDLDRELPLRLLPLPAQERRDEAWEALEEVVGDQESGIVLAGTDILFEPSLGYRPYEALRRLARIGPIVASWFGTVEGGQIVRAHPGHPEHVRVRLDVPFVFIEQSGGVGK